MSLKDFSSTRMNELWDMSLTDGINYVLFKNPISSTVIDSMKGLANSTVFKGAPASPPTVKLPPDLQNLPVGRLVLSGNIFTRLAGVSGAAAVIIGAYGAHSLVVKEGYEEQKRIYQTANHYHLIHSLALLGVPLCRHPKIAGSFITIGMILFCGTCYYDAFTGKTNFRKFTPVGGTCLILGWLCFLI